MSLRGGRMPSKWSAWTAVALGIGGVAVVSLVMLAAGQQPAGAPAIDGDDIGGVVTGARGPGAGVWGVAGTGNTPRGLVRGVVTGEQGRFPVPRLPKGGDEVWG